MYEERKQDCITVKDPCPPMAFSVPKRNTILVVWRRRRRRRRKSQYVDPCYYVGKKSKLRGLLRGIHPPSHRLAKYHTLTLIYWKPSLSVYSSWPTTQHLAGNRRQLLVSSDIPNLLLHTVLLLHTATPVSTFSHSLKKQERIGSAGPTVYSTV